jgi:hypothetical protein
MDIQRDGGSGRRFRWRGGMPARRIISLAAVGLVASACGSPQETAGHSSASLASRIASASQPTQAPASSADSQTSVPTASPALSTSAPPPAESSRAASFSPPQLPPTLSPTPNGTPPHLLLTDKENGDTIVVAVGTFIEVDAAAPTSAQLSAPVTSSNPAVLQPVGGSSGPAPTITNTFRARAPGRSELRAPVIGCPPGAPACLAPGVGFSITVDN